MTQIFNKQLQKIIRRKLRQEPIGCERKLWSKLRNNQLGYKFRRQFGIGQYIVDFYCPKLRLVIEIDGATHCTEEEKNNDRVRQEYLENLGLTVKRYWNIDIKNNFSEVIYDIQKVCEQLACKEND
jgi:very-short-patch-repair endonuclease